MSDQSNDCIFCKIATGELETAFVVETENVVAFNDITPRAATHVQVIPKQHVKSVRELTRDNGTLWSEMLQVANEVAAKLGIDETGYRLVTNTGPDAGQEVFHLHLHVLGGEKLGRIA